jgi:hypothetical protein
MTSSQPPSGLDQQVVHQVATAERPYDIGQAVQPVKRGGTLVVKLRANRGARRIRTSVGEKRPCGDFPARIIFRHPAGRTIGTTRTVGSIETAILDYIA